MADKNYHDVLINWLKSAYTIETSLVNMLENQAERATEFSDLRNRLHGHREATQRHADMVEDCITHLGGDVSEVRAQVSKFIGEAQSRMLGTFGDSVVRDSIVGAMVEELESSTYNAIITLANRLDEQKVVDTCSQILEEEEQMREYFDDNIENIVNQAYEHDTLTE